MTSEASNTPHARPDSTPFRRWWQGALLALVTSVIVVEVFARYEGAGEASSLVSAPGWVNGVKNRARLWYQTLSQPPEIRELLTLAHGQRMKRRQWMYQEILTPEREAVMRELEARYARGFEALVAAIRANQARTAVLFLTRPPFAGNAKQRGMRRLVEGLCARLDVPLLDTQPLFSVQPVGRWYISTDNHHLSAAGHSRLAEWLLEQPILREVERCAVAFDARPALLGDAAPGLDGFRGTRPRWHLRTNGQGLRYPSALAFPKTRPRILFIGDSMTDPRFVSNEAMWTTLINQRQTSVEAIQHGQSGWTVEDYLHYYQDCGRFIEADLVVFQAMVNDRTDLLAIQRIVNARNPQLREAPDLPAAERQLLRDALAVSPDRLP